MKKYLILAWVLFSSLSFLAASEIDSRKNSSNKRLLPSDNIVLVNRSKTVVTFFYFDKFHQQIRFHIRPGVFYRIDTNDNIFLIQSNKVQNFYLLYPKDSLVIDVTKGDNAELKSIRNPSFNAELGFSVRMHEKMALNFWSIMQYRSKYINTNYKRIDSLYRQEYLQSTAFLEGESKRKNFSSGFIHMVKSYFTSHYFGSQLFFIGMQSKDTIHPSYQAYLYSLKDTIAGLMLNGENEWVYRLQLNYSKYMVRKYIGSEVYNDSLYTAASRQLTGRLREEVLLLIVLEELAADKKSSKWFIKDYIESTPSLVYQKYLKRLMEDNELLYTVSKEDMLISPERIRNSYNDVINNLKGKLVYLDVWASWCMPCRAEMPASATLRKIYKNKPVAFIYISIDDDFGRWQSASAIEKLDQSDGTFLFSNFNASSFKKAFEISTIPRYILIGKNGKFINADMARPSEQKLKEIIDRNL